MKKDAQTIPNEANAENNITRLIEKAAKKLAATAHHVYDNKGLMEY